MATSLLSSGHSQRAKLPRTQTTLANELAVILNIPALSLDTVHWNPGWVETPNDEFRARVRAFLDSHPDGWVIDGNYVSHLGTVVQDAATDVLCEHHTLMFKFVILRVCAWKGSIRRSYSTSGGS